MMHRDTWNDMIKIGYLYQELDWLAVDNKGQLGIFAASMNAPIPEKVKSSFENYEKLRQRIDLVPKATISILVTPAKGDFSNWIRFAEKGFFAFDFQDVHRTEKKNQYDLIAKPARPLIIDELHLPSMIADSLAKLDCDFADGDVATDKVR